MNDVAISADQTALKGPAKQIGDILVESGKLTPEQVSQIVALQQRDGLPFGEAGVALNLVTKEDLLFALSKQYDYSYLDPVEGGLSTELITAYKPFSAVGENIRALRAQLSLRWFSQDPRRKALALVSPVSGEGKSFMTANLAVAFAQQGMKTLLIDGNLRNPRQQNVFQLSKGPGLSSVLSERVSIATAIDSVPVISNLSILSAGPLPPNPAELLGRPVFTRALAYAASMFDVVLVDTPAGEAFSDAEIIAAQTGAAMLVTRKNQSSMAKSAKFARTLREMGVAMVGSVLNDA